MSLRGWLFALTYDRQMAGLEQAGLAERRRRLLAGIEGRVLEIGGGTGANIPYYGEAVESLTITEPEPPLVRRLEQRARAQAAPVSIVRAAAESLPFPDGSFDAAVSTLVLCGVDDQARALRELRRVLRPDGRLALIEHVRSDEPRLARLQDRVNRLNRLVAGCDCNRRTLDAVRAGRFELLSVEHTSLERAPRFVRPLVIVTASAGHGAG